MLLVEALLVSCKIFWFVKSIKFMLQKTSGFFIVWLDLS